MSSECYSSAPKGTWPAHSALITPSILRIIQAAVTNMTSPAPPGTGMGPFLPLYYCTRPIIVREDIAPKGKCMALWIGYFKVTIYDFDFIPFKFYHPYIFVACLYQRLSYDSTKTCFCYLSSRKT